METRPPELEQSLEPSNIVGVGASAGGLEALEAFFSNLPPDSGLAFVVVQHLSPDHKSMMAELLSKKTIMPVLRAEEGTPVRPNHVYLIPPRKNLSIFHRKLCLSEQDAQRGVNYPIDGFLQSLATDEEQRAIAVILSGSGSDGTRGVRAIKESGGLVFVQKPDTAKFDSMPQAAIATGLADFVLAPKDMPERIVSCVQHPYSQRSSESVERAKEDDALTQIFSRLRDKTKVDFSQYKLTTVMRRIERRMVLNQVFELEDYVKYIDFQPGELHQLFRELLIGVTSFFRDPEVFDSLQSKHLPRLLRQSEGKEVRFWVAGCSTGEEAFSLAIATKECLESHRMARDVKIFATDIDQDALHTSGLGEYPSSIAADIPSTILNKYFYATDGGFRISRHIREMVVFAKHNAVKDPPFTKIDLVSCRNLLIYLQSELQHRLLEFFNFSLSENGILVLGSSETVGDMQDCFETLDSRLRIYRSTGKVRFFRQAVHQAPGANSTRLGAATETRFGPKRSVNNREHLILRRLLDSVQDDYVPLSIIVNEQLEIQHVLGDTQGLFKIPSGEPVNDISKMTSRDLAIPISTGLQKVMRTGEEIVYSNFQVRIQDKDELISLRMKPLAGKKTDEPLSVIFIERIVDTEERKGRAIDSSAMDLSREAEQHIKDLEQELQFTKENLQATIEELETANEELQATNEELLASNEELQSTNEELQSTNEELHTVNTEYQSKIIELTELHNDLDHLLSSSQIGNLFLDENLEIRRFSPQISKIFRVLQQDIGRPLSHISHFLKDYDPLDDIRTVVSDNKLLEREVLTLNGEWYLMRIVPYHIGPEHYSGLVITFIDISSIKKVKQDLVDERAWHREIINLMTPGIAVYEAVNEGEDFRLIFMNSGAYTLDSLGTSELKGKTLTELFAGAEDSGVLEVFRRVWKKGTKEHFSGLGMLDEDSSHRRTGWVHRLESGEVVSVIEADNR